MSYSFDKFLTAQETDYAKALAEIKAGRKRSHWIWYIFPQVAGLGLSSTSRFYALSGTQEAAAYLAHPVLGKRLKEISEALLALPGNNPTAVLGTPDDLKLRSCMTLFALVKNTDPVFQAVLNKFYNGKMDEETLRIIKPV